MDADLRLLAWLDPPYLLDILRRRLWVFGLVAALCSAGGIGVALVLPPVYEARAVLLVEGQQIPSEFVRPTVDTPLSQQIEVIRQRLMNRETLLELAERHRVFAAEPDLTPTERLWRMQQSVSFDQRTLGPSWGRGDSVSTTLTVAFRSGSAEQSAAVANDLVTRILQQSAELRRSSAQSTSDYFRQEVRRLSGELGRLEARITAFQSENKEALPESLDYRRSQLDLLQERLQRFELETLTLEQERASLKLALGQDRGADAPPPTETEEELATLRRTLAQRQVILTEDHPEVRALTTRIRVLERVAEAEAASAAAGGPAPVRAEDPARQELSRRLGAVETRLAFNEEVVADLKAQREALESSLLATPNVQMELGALQRTHETLEERYQAARAKLVQAEAGEELEHRQQGERLEVIEQALVPEYPIAPNRRAYAMAGVAGGVAGGLGLILLLEMMSAVARRPEDLVRIGRPPAAVIPYIATPAERIRTWTLRGLVVLVVVGGAAGALWAVHTYYLPLETVWEKILEKSGLDDALALVRRRLGL